MVTVTPELIVWILGRTGPLRLKALSKLLGSRIDPDALECVLAELLASGKLCSDDDQLCVLEEV
jgi:hypothetical protein